ncbi:MAG: aminoacyl-tRNA hydrolase [Nitrospirota bacterium]|nr:MAG: aminoacyl-tRNA hydrolase [Nitrospirota bacterium]
MHVIAGLGNPGSEYERTRHNLGFITVDAIADRIGANFKKNDNYLKAEGFIGGKKVLLIKPLTFMNLSGAAVTAAMSYYKADIGDLIVIHDDLDIETGRIKIKVGGGTAGHKGIDSIISSLGSKDFIRIKIGIGRPPHDNIEGYVLGKIASEEARLSEEAIKRSADAVEIIINEGLEKAMNLYNSGPESDT